VTPRWTRRLAEALLLVVILGGLYAWRTRDLLPVDQRTPAPGFSLVDLDGRRWTPLALHGKPAVLYFFAPWCPVCSASAPQLRWFDRWAGDSVQVVLVALDASSTEELVAHARKHGLRMPILIGNATTAAAYRIRGYPTYYVLDSQGRVAGRDFGYTTAPGLWLRTRGT
jgi:thiol-disulfide isomerase/thioredoxin